MAKLQQETVERLMCWARLWSPLAEDADHDASWVHLELPGEFAALRNQFWNAFHVGNPQPRLPLLLHVLLQREGTAVREDMTRVAQYLELEWSDKRLPPDHLAPVCEMLAMALDEDQPVLVDGLVGRYLHPWLIKAMAAADADLLPVLDRFQRDLPHE